MGLFADRKTDVMEQGCCFKDCARPGILAMQFAQFVEELERQPGDLRHVQVVASRGSGLGVNVRAAFLRQ